MLSITTLIKNSETDAVEFKTSFQKEAIESVVAFANAKGGKIFVGVSDSGKILGINTNREFEEFQHGFRIIPYKDKLEKNNGGVNGGVNKILDYISKNPNINAVLISEKLNIPLRIVQRLVKELKVKKKIEFRGAAKIGGYFAK